MNRSVGLGGINQQEDVKWVQALLNAFISACRINADALVVDGHCGPRTVAAIQQYQRLVFKSKNPTGLLQPDQSDYQLLYREYGRRFMLDIDDQPDLLTPNLQWKALSLEDHQKAAQLLGCEVAIIHAVVAVESSGSGFLPSGRPKILFEAHKFSEQTGRRYDRSHPKISSPTWNRTLYSSAEGEYKRLALAIELDETAALKSASWGLFQIMGFNFKACGYESVQTYVRDMFVSEAQHLQAFIRYIQTVKLVSALKSKDWAGFASRYNGPSYRANQYDSKLQAAYARYA